jgi:hypothetical protein
MAAPQCAECDLEIEGEIAWFRPFADLVQEDQRTFRFVSTASNEPRSGNELPFHPACFEKRTGQKLPAQ